MLLVLVLGNVYTKVPSVTHRPGLLGSKPPCLITTPEFAVISCAVTVIVAVDPATLVLDIVDPNIFAVELPTTV